MNMFFDTLWVLCLLTKYNVCILNYSIVLAFGKIGNGYNLSVLQYLNNKNTFFHKITTTINI